MTEDGARCLGDGLQRLEERDEQRCGAEAAGKVLAGGSGHTQARQKHGGGSLREHRRAGIH
ncbi:MAG TPA: hypothetical protein VM219_08050 [Phycisphaerae bacterium]|nr:hypothetical protein [Phycisphaerae bacterium]